MLRDEGVVRHSRRDGVTRTDMALPRDIAPLARAIHAGLNLPHNPSWLLGLPGAEDELSPVANRVLGARLRVGPACRAIGSLAAFAAPVTSMVALAHSVGNVVTGVAVTVVTVLVACWLIALRGITVLGSRTLAAAPRPLGARSQATERGGLMSAVSASFVVAGLDRLGDPGGFGRGADGDSSGGDSGGY